MCTPIKGSGCGFRGAPGLAALEALVAPRKVGDAAGGAVPVACAVTAHPRSLRALKYNRNGILDLVKRSVLLSAHMRPLAVTFRMERAPLLKPHCSSRLSRAHCHGAQLE